MERLINYNPTTLGAAITSTSATSITLASVTGLPSSGTCRLLIDTEYMICTLNGTTTVTVTRGAESSTAATHSSGADVYFVTTAGAINSTFADRTKSGSASSRPSAGVAGRIWKSSDCSITSLDNGTAWEMYHDNGLIVTPPVISAFTGYGTASGTPIFVLQQQGDTVFAYFNSITDGDASHCGAWVEALPSGDVSGTIGMNLVHGAGSTQILCGMCLYESATGKCLGFTQQYYYPNNPPHSFAVEELILSGSGSSYGSGVSSQNFAPSQMRFIKVVVYNSGATIDVYVSPNGINWSYTQSLTTSTYFTTAPDNIGLFIFPANLPSNGGSGGLVQSYSGMEVFHWEVKTLV